MMKRQIGFAEAEIAGKKRVTRRQRFLAEMEKVVPWQRLLSAIEPHYPKGTRGRPPIGLERMLRIYFLGSFENGVGNGLQRACELNAEKSSLPAMRNRTVRMVSKRAYPRALRLAA